MRNNSLLIGPVPPDFFKDKIVSKVVAAKAGTRNWQHSGARAK